MSACCSPFLSCKIPKSKSNAVGGLKVGGSFVRRVALNIVLSVYYDAYVPFHDITGEHFANSAAFIEPT